MLIFWFCGSILVEMLTTGEKVVPVEETDSKAVRSIIRLIQLFTLLLIFNL